MGLAGKINSHLGMLLWRCSGITQWSLANKKGRGMEFGIELRIREREIWEPPDEEELIEAVRWDKQRRICRDGK